MEDSNKALEQCLQESEMSISERLDPSPKHDAGHYVDLPLVRNEKTLEIADGETFEKVYVLGGDTGALSELPFANVIVGAGARRSASARRCATGCLPARRTSCSTVLRQVMLS